MQIVATPSTVNRWAQSSWCVLTMDKRVNEMPVLAMRPLGSRVAMVDGCRYDGGCGE